jgi:tRNA threonylcarbamoyladenosine dehydratase
MTPSAPPLPQDEADLERRFGGLRRLHGDAGYAQLRAARVAVVGLGGVGSWAVEALARCGVARLVLIDLDHVSESNINRQVQATSNTLGMSKVQALAERIALIHPGCEVLGIEEFVSAENWPALLPGRVDALIDACDQSSAKLSLAAWALEQRLPFVCVGAAGGKRQPQAVEVADLADTTHDPLLASLRQRLRKTHGAARAGAIGVRCVFSREAVLAPSAAGCAIDEDPGHDSSLNCHGYGSSVTVTATFGMVAAAQVVELLLDPGLKPRLDEALQRASDSRPQRSTALPI